MARARRFRERGLRPALVVGGITLGILLLFFLQFALPYWIGPLGLVAVVIVDTAIYLELRRRRVRRSRLRKGIRVDGGPLDRGSVTHAKRPIPDEIVVTIAFLVFVLGLVLEGVGLGADSWAPGKNAFLVLAGAVITMSTYVIMRLYGWRSLDWRIDWYTESEKYDTTEDH